MKRVLSFILTLCLLLGLAAFSSAEEVEDVKSEGVMPRTGAKKQESPCICSRYTGQIRLSRSKVMAEAGQMLT